MIIPGASPACGAPRSAHAQSARKRIAIVVSALPLVAAFVLAGAPTATAVTAATAFTNNHVTSTSDLRSRPCRGNKPGVCPNSVDMQGPGPLSDGFGQVYDHSGDDAKRNKGAY